MTHDLNAERDAGTPALVCCDHCYQPVVVVGSEYKHYDPYDNEDAPTRGWFWCRTTPYDFSLRTHCEVNGRDAVPEEATR